ncbi:MAG: ATP-binding protein, partial [Chloroflexi bacterium]
MDLNDFGTQCDGAPRQPPQDNAFYHHERNFLPQENPTAPIQWKVSLPGVYEACGSTHRQLPAGAYTCSLNQYGEPQLLAKDLQVDDLIDFADSLPSQILQEIENFWSLGERFQRYGYLHRRGYLLYGPQGSGKSSMVHQVVHRIIKAGHVAVFADHPGVLTRAMELLRKIEPERPLVCMFEDIDAVIEIHG